MTGIPGGDRHGPSGPRHDPDKGISVGEYAGLGIQFAASIVVFLYLGQWLDRKLGAGGLITVIAAFVGFGGTMYWLIRSLSRKDPRE